MRRSAQAMHCGGRGAGRKRRANAAPKSRSKIAGVEAGGRRK